MLEGLDYLEDGGLIDTVILEMVIWFKKKTRLELAGRVSSSHFASSKYN